MIANPFGAFEYPIQHYYAVVQCLVTMKNIPFLYCHGNEQIGSTVWLYNMKYKEQNMQFSTN